MGFRIDDTRSTYADTVAVAQNGSWTGPMIDLNTSVGFSVHAKTTNGLAGNLIIEVSNYDPLRPPGSGMVWTQQSSTAVGANADKFVGVSTGTDGNALARYMRCRFTAALLNSGGTLQLATNVRFPST